MANDRGITPTPDDVQLDAQHDEAAKDRELLGALLGFQRNWIEGSNEHIIYSQNDTRGSTRQAILYIVSTNDGIQTASRADTSSNKGVYAANFFISNDTRGLSNSSISLTHQGGEAFLVDPTSGEALTGFDSDVTAYSSPFGEKNNVYTLKIKQNRTKGVELHANDEQGLTRNRLGSTALMSDIHATSLFAYLDNYMPKTTAALPSTESS